MRATVSENYEPIHAKMLIPDLLRAAPQVRPVLDRYGLHGCGGPDGPVETLGFFAKAHEVPLERLLHELRAGLTAKRPESQAGPAPGDAIYRPFFKAGIVVVLSLGAVWGAWLLLRIGFRGTFTAAGIHEVNPHGHAQIFGWVGLFVMGFAYQAFPRFKHAALACPRLALASLWVMLAGIITRCGCEPLAETVVWAGPVAVAAALVEVFAIGLFVAVLAATWQRAGRPLEFYDAYIVCALVWFVVQAGYEAVYLAATLACTSRDELVSLVATWQAPLRDIQIHGFALLMILGVSQRFFHNFYGFPAPNRRVSRMALVALNLAVIGEAGGLILMRTAGHAWAALWFTSVLLLTTAAAWLVGGWRLWSSPEEFDRSLKFLRAAYVWLFISLAMLVLIPAYQFGLLAWLAPESAAAQVGFSHAYYGAIRHAITVGFVSLMIVGVAAKVVPTLNGVPVQALSPLWGPFLLINAGCALRVTGQTLTDFTPQAFPWAGISGLLEVTGLALWGGHLWQIMAGRARLCRPVGPYHENGTPLDADGPILPAHRVGEVLKRHPELLETFLRFGFRPLANPVLRRTLARVTTIAAACRHLGVDETELLAALNRERQRPPRQRVALPVLAVH